MVASVQTLNDRIILCTKCEICCNKPVPPISGKTNHTMMVFDNPKYEESLIGEPISTLEQVFLKKHIDYANVYITNLVKCRAYNDKDRAPNKEEIKNCTPYLIEEIQTVKPKVIFGFGNLTNKKFLGKSFSNNDIYIPTTFNNIRYIPCYNLKYTLGRSIKEVNKLIDILKSETI